MDEDLLADQFETLEEPEDMLAVDADQKPEAIVHDIEVGLGLQTATKGQQPPNRGGGR